MPEDDVAHLSVGTLKAILFRNHVNATLVVEKSELVGKVRVLIEDEKRERAEAAARAEEEEREMQEMRERMARARREREEAVERAARERAEGGSGGEGSNAGGGEGGGGEKDKDGDGGEQKTDAPSGGAVPTGRMSPRAQVAASHLERTGLCVICQDEEANIAVVDCGYVLICSLHL